MISGLKNLGYLASGVRTYGEQPVLSRVRERWEFQFIFRGRARPTEVECGFSEGSGPRLYVSHPESPHGWTDDRGGISEVFVVQYLEVPDELIGQIKPTKPIVIDLDEAVAERMMRRCEEARRAVAAGDVQASLFFQRLLMELTTVALSRAVDQARKVDATDKVVRAMNWFEENVAGAPTVQDAARAVGLSAAHMRRLFAEAGRPSPQAELARLRMDAAKRCLVEGWEQKAVAELLGFSEPSAFARAFRDYEGVPPGKWVRTRSQGARKRRDR